ncbi:hypothetical protein HNV11_16055 [Spirosoma taeanense]|uniref:Uncharacterized protein n=1 Tax=Spirosoma taeanense TaxID=2735870 RepID=A0A6M5YBY6_9BACT|nr:hypothetical protein [Spirosoma taeanense]QJW90783.1 hypothetical protein HNV11_16055 [Spirosoma taeanense]
MKANKITYLLITMVALMSSTCDKGDPLQAPDRSALKIALVDSLAIEYDDDERRLPESIRELCAVVTSESKDCNRVFILDPILARIDQKKEFVLKTTIEKGGSKDVSNPKVIGRLIQKNFDEIEVPKAFSVKAATGVDAGNLISEYISTKAINDSIIVFSEGGLDNYVLNKKTHKVYTSIDEVRKKIISVLCENDKANFTLLVNPPTIKPGPKEVVNVIPKPASPPVNRPRPVANPPIRRPQAKINGDLTIIEGSEGCDICTRYYTATDNVGRRHEVREKNSTSCCPCDKTVEIKGRTYRMDCGAGSNRLALVQ